MKKDSNFEELDEICNMIEITTVRHILEIYPQFLKNKTNISFNFFEKNSLNAYAKYDYYNDTYEIYLGKKLISELRNISLNIINNVSDDKDISHMTRNELSKLEDSIFYFWIHFICHHEWFHIARGHLNYGSKNIDKCFKINELQTNDYTKNNNIGLCFEIDADRYAWKFVFGSFIMTVDNLEKELNLTVDVLLKFFIKSMMYIFDLFVDLGGNNRGTEHPAPSERMIITIMSIQEAIHIKPEILEKFDMNEETFIMMSTTLLREHFKNHELKYKLDIDKLIFTSQLWDDYIQTLKNMKLDEYQLLREF